MSDPDKTSSTQGDRDPIEGTSSDVPADATQPTQAALPSRAGATPSAEGAPGSQLGVTQGPAPSAVTPTRPAASSAPARSTVRTVHYTLSYFVRNQSAGPRGAIVLLHDLPGGAFTWQDVLPALDATGRAVYAFDLLGYGQSEHPWPSDTSVWGHADNLSYALAALNLSEIVLVGLGLGGGVAQVLATRLYRQRVAKLVLIGSYGYEYAFAPNWPLPDMAKRQDPDAPKHTPTDQLIADLRATLPQAAADAKYLAGSALDAYVNEWNSHVGAELLFQHIRLMIPLYMNSVSSYLRTLDTPTLLIWGEQDTVTPVDLLGRRMAREMPNARLEVIPGAGHMLLDEAAPSVARLLADFAGSRQDDSFVVTSARRA
jgi:pimeloyl-ACP methyl ester carboxylesterase